MVHWWQIKASLDVPDVLDNLGIRVSRVDGNEHFASCPLSSHTGDDRNPSFSVNDEKKVYSCFACGGSGTIPNLVMDIENMAWQESLDWLAEFSDVVADDHNAFMRQIKDSLSPKIEVDQPNPIPWYSPRIISEWSDTETDWFEKRGINSDTRQLLRLGFDPEHERMSRNVNNSYIGPAIIVPHFFGGQLCGWQERWLDDGRPRWIGKYTNTEGFPKKHTLYNYDRSMASDQVIVVEGSLTVARLVQLGYNAVGTFGASVSDEQWNMLLGFNDVFLSFDNDDAGYKAMVRGINHLRKRTNVWVIDPPEHKRGADLADIDDSLIPAFIEKAEPGFTKV